MYASCIYHLDKPLPAEKSQTWQSFRQSSLTDLFPYWYQVKYQCFSTTKPWRWLLAELHCRDEQETFNDKIGVVYYFRQNIDDAKVTGCQNMREYGPFRLKEMWRAPFGSFMHNWNTSQVKAVVSLPVLTSQSMFEHEKLLSPLLAFNWCSQHFLQSHITIQGMCPYLLSLVTLPCPSSSVVHLLFDRFSQSIAISNTSWAKGFVDSENIRTQMNVTQLAKRAERKPRRSSSNVSATIPSAYIRSSTIPVSGKTDAFLPAWLARVTHNQPSTETQKIREFFTG